MKIPKNGHRKVFVALGTSLVLCSLIAAGCLLISWHTSRIAGLAITQMANVLSNCEVDSDSIKELSKFYQDVPLTLSFFHRDMTWFSGKRINPTHALMRDMEFAIRSGLRVRNPAAGYEVVPKTDAVIVVMANPGLLSGLVKNDWLWWAAAVLVLTIITFTCAYSLLQPGRQLDMCRDFLERIIGQQDTCMTIEELLDRSSARLEELEHHLRDARAASRRLADEVKQLRRSLRKTTQDLEATQEHLLRAGTLTALGEFAAGISHELNNPMGIVLGFTQHLLDEVPPDHPHSPKLKRMEIELGRCQRILQDLLAFARPLEPTFAEVDVNRLVRDTLQFIFYPEIEGIEITCNLEEDLPTIWVDPDQTEQILINLIKNAIQAIHDSGKIVVSTSTTTLSREDTVMLTAPVIQPGVLLMEDPGSTLSMRVPRIDGAIKTGDLAVRIDISDTGSGICPDDFKKIFTPFYTTKKDGTGLGLSICWKLVRRNRGILKVKSSPEEGTTFSIIFPVQEGTDHGT